MTGACRQNVRTYKEERADYLYYFKIYIVFSVFQIILKQSQLEKGNPDK